MSTQSNDRSVAAGDGAVISRRMLLKSGAGAFAAAYSLGTRPAWAARGAGARIDDVAIRRLFAQTAKSLITPGAFMLVRAPGFELTQAYGTGVLDQRGDLAAGDHVRIGSVTKTFTGTVILQAAQRGAVRLEDPVSRFRSDVPNGKRITIEQLLSMRNGLHNYTQSRAPNRTMDTEPRHELRSRDLLRIAYAARPHPIPGERFEYCNTNTILLGLIAEQLYRRPLAAIFEHHLFEPLGMSRTSMPALRSAGIPSPHPRGYMFATNLSTLHTDELPPRQRAAAEAGRLKPHDVTMMNPSRAGAAGAAISTAEDLAKWARGMCDADAAEPPLTPTAPRQHPTHRPVQPARRGLRPRDLKARRDVRARSVDLGVPNLRRLRPGAPADPGHLDEPQGLTSRTPLRADDRAPATRAPLRLNRPMIGADMYRKTAVTVKVVWLSGR